MRKAFPCDIQLDLKDCGPACLKMIAKYYGKYYSLQYLRDKCGITREGVSFLDISFASEKIGLKTLSIKCTIDDLIEKVPLPVIVHWDNSHFIVVYHTDHRKGYISVSDPAKGRVKFKTKEFAQRWIKEVNGTYGVVMAIKPQASFYEKQEDERIKKRKTFGNFLNYLIPYKKSFIQLCVVMLIVTLLQALLPFISKAVIDVGIQTHDIDFINIVLIANIAIYVSILLSNMARDWILLHVTSRVNIALISDYLNKLMSLPISFFENKLTGDILQRANDHERIRNFVVNNSLSMLFSTLTFGIFAIILLVYNKIVFLFLLLAVYFTYCG